MLKYTLRLCFVFSTLMCSSQVDQHESFNVLFGYGIHGSGDLRGFQYGIQYSKDFGKKWSWSLELGGSLHDGPGTTLIYQDDLGRDVDATLHFVVAGLQLGGGINYHIVKNEYHDFRFAVLPFARYQASSISDFIGTIFPGASDLPFPVRNIVRFEPARTLSIGSSFRMNYKYHFGNDYMGGIGGTFQTDTNGDTIASVLISFGKRF